MKKSLILLLFLLKSTVSYGEEICPCFYQPSIGLENKYIVSINQKAEKDFSKKYSLVLSNNLNKKIKTYEVVFFSSYEQSLKNIFYQDINFDGFLDIGIKINTFERSDTIYFIFKPKKTDLQFVGFFKQFKIDKENGFLYTYNEENNKSNDEDKVMYFWKGNNIYASRKEVVK